MSLLTVDRLTKEYVIRQGPLRRRVGDLIAVDDVSFTIDAGSSFGLLGESGCGKSTLARIVLALERPTNGYVRLHDDDVHRLRGNELKKWRQKVQIVFQDPYGALAPRMRIGTAVEEPLRIQAWGDRASRRAKVKELLQQVGLAASYGERYPHELSGGQRQRVVIARALALEPTLIICDEPTSALDVSVQARVLELLRSLQDRHGLTYLFISHDLGVVRHVSEQIGVMYLGAMVERGPADAIYRSPRHPYTHALLSAVPSIRSRRRSWATSVVPGEPPSPLERPSGCRFRSRCPLATKRCAEERPELREIAPRHWSACHYAEDVHERLKHVIKPTRTAEFPSNASRP